MPCDEPRNELKKQYESYCRSDFFNKVMVNHIKVKNYSNDINVNGKDP